MIKFENVCELKIEKNLTIFKNTFLYRLRLTYHCKIIF